MTRIRQSIFVILLILNTFTVWSQQNFYNCYSGNSNETHYRLHLIKANNQLQATLLVKGENYLDAEQFDLLGKIQDNGNFFLGKNYSTDTLLFGRLSAYRIEAYLLNSANELNLIHLETCTDTHFIDLDITCFKKQQALDSTKPDSPKAIFEIQFLHSSTINSPMDSLFLLQSKAEKVKANSIDDILAEKANTFFKDYKKLNSFENTDSPTFQWIRNTEVGVQLNQQNLLSFFVFDYAYTGGAHGLSNKIFFVFDFDLSKKLVLNDLFDTIAFNKIEVLIEQAIRNQYNVSSDSNLTSAGFFTDSIPITENFWISAAGIGFYYNNYEIAPYSSGPTAVLLPYSKISKLIKPEFRERLDPVVNSLNSRL